MGRRVQIFKLPAVTGHTLLYVGNDVRFNGSFGVASGRFCDHPTTEVKFNEPDRRERFPETDKTRLKLAPNLQFGQTLWCQDTLKD